MGVDNLQLRDVLDKAAIDVVGFWPRWKRGANAPASRQAREDELKRLNDRLLVEELEANLRNLELIARESWLVKGGDSLSVIAHGLEATRRSLALHGGPEFAQITDEEAAARYDA